jgi:hypothetical protein
VSDGLVAAEVDVPELRLHLGDQGWVSSLLCDLQGAAEQSAGIQSLHALFEPELP